MKINKKKWIKFINDENKYSIDCGTRPDKDELLESIKSEEAKNSMVNKVKHK